MQVVGTAVNIRIREFHVRARGHNVLFISSWWPKAQFLSLPIIFTKHQQNKWLAREAGESKTTCASRKMMWRKTWKWSQNGKSKKAGFSKIKLACFNGMYNRLFLNLYLWVCMLVFICKFLSSANKHHCSIKVIAWIITDGCWFIYRMDQVSLKGHCSVCLHLSVVTSQDVFV